MVQQFVYAIAVLGFIVVLFAGIMSLRLFATRGPKPVGASTLNDTPEVRKMLYTLLAAVMICAVAAFGGVSLAFIRLM